MDKIELDPALEAACLAYWPFHWPTHFSEQDATSIRGHMSKAIRAYLAATASEPVAWLGEGDGFKTFTRRKSVANMWATGTAKVTPVFTTPPAAPTAIDVAIEALSHFRQLAGVAFSTGKNRDEKIAVTIPVGHLFDTVTALASLKATRETA